MPKKSARASASPRSSRAPDVYQDLAESLARTGLGLERRRNLALGHDAARHEHVSKASLGRRGVHRGCLEDRHRLGDRVGLRERPEFRPAFTLDREGVAGGL
jgi:hypothetical protein